MAEQTDERGISLPEIERALQLPCHRLSFPANIEAQFEEDGRRERCRYLQRCGLIGLVIYNLFLISDAQLIPDLFRVSVVIHLCVITPLALGMMAILRTNPPKWLRESLEVAMKALITLSVVALFVKSRSPYVQHYHYPVLLVLLFANTVQRLRFPYACTASALSLLIYTGGIHYAPHLPEAVAVTAVTNLVASAILGLITNFYLEKDLRNAYLMGMRDELRVKELRGTYEELNELSSRDAVTGLANRRRMDDFVSALWRSAAGWPVAVLMIDVDLFKEFNDTYGHPAGDRCLRKIGGLVEEQLRRDIDLVARFGGEEFIAIVPGANLWGGMQAAERIRKAIETEALEHNSSRAARVVTVSIGVASIGMTEDFNFERLVAAADAELYEAKRGGRNRVWPPPEPEDEERVETELASVQLS